MRREEIGHILLSVLEEVQGMSGRPCVGLGLDTKPIGDLDGFDSLSGVETTVMIEQRLGCKLEVESLFVSEDGKQVLSVREIEDRLAAAVWAKGGGE